MLIFQLFILIVIIQVSTQYSINPRIINGRDASPNQYPFIAFIESGLPPLVPYSHECAGVIYDEFHILTTALCIIKATTVSKARVKIGMHSTRKDPDNVQIIEIADIIIHQNYSRNFWTNDIGIIILETAISNHVAAALSERDFPQGEVWIAGWGGTSFNIFGAAPKVLQHASLGVMSKRECRATLMKTEFPTILRDSHLCIYSPRKVVTAYDTDIGGPVMQIINGEIEIIGLISFILYPHICTNVPTINTKISHFIPWITGKIHKIPNRNLNGNLETPLLVPQG